MAIKLLCIDDDAGAARLLQKRLKRLDYCVDIACDGQEGLEMVINGQYDVLTIDQSMPHMDGMQVIRHLAERGPLPPIVMVTGAGNESLAAEAMKLGASDYIVKDTGGGYLELLPAVLEQAVRQHHMAEEKRQAEEERERLIQELDSFAHTVAHDLKNPLTTIVTSASFARHAKLSFDDMQQTLDVIEQTAYKMRNIINELLLLSHVRKIEDIQREVLDMGLIALSAHERLTHLMKTYRAHLIFPEEWPLAVGYGPWIEEVWANYISNAIKYGGTPPRIELGGDTLTTAGMARFWVRDNGAGLSQEEQQRLFTPFTRLSQARAQGHGLGLSIVQRIVEKLGGHVGVESTVGQGSLFYFTLPKTV